MSVMELRMRALQVLAIEDPGAKAEAARTLYAAVLDGRMPLDERAPLACECALPGRPSRPRLVPPALVPRRSPYTRGGRQALLHAVTHIEFNAINLALDAVWRFAGLPRDYYLDWLRVASEEAHHYTLLSAHLSALGCAYGDFDAHDGLWSMCEKTKADLVARMALVPRTLEARGLDATPLMQARLLRAGDRRAVEILDIILADEVGHVSVGNRWYRWACARAGLEPRAHYRRLVLQYDAPRLKPPFNLPARRLAGFDDDEMADMIGGPSP